MEQVFRGVGVRIVDWAGRRGDDECLDTQRLLGGPDPLLSLARCLWFAIGEEQQVSACWAPPVLRDEQSQGRGVQR